MLANGAAGSVDEKTLATVASVLAHRAPTVVHRTVGADDVDGALTSLDGRRPVVVGGDGSLHLVVNRLLALDLGDVPLGLVPLGTGNDLARGLGLSLDPAEAAALVAEGGEVLPLAVAVHPSGERVVNNAHLGIGERAARVSQRLKPALGPAAYPAGAVVAGIRPDPQDVVVVVDGEEVYDGPVAVVLVALGPSAGGGHELAPDARLGDSRLHVLVIPACSLLDRMRVAAAVARRSRHRDGSDLRRWTGHRVEVRPQGRSARAATGWDVDGELFEWDGVVDLALEPAAWKLVAPATAPSPGLDREGTG